MQPQLNEAALANKIYSHLNFNDKENLSNEEDTYNNLGQLSICKNTTENFDRHVMFISA